MIRARVAPSTSRRHAGLARVQQRGSVFVELALVLPLLILLSLAVIEFASVISDYRVITHQTRIAARYLSQRSPGQDIAKATCLALYGVESSAPCSGSLLLPQLATATVTISDASNQPASQFAQQVAIASGSTTVNLVTVTISGYHHKLVTGTFLTGLFNGTPSIPLPPVSTTMRQSL